MEGPIRPWQCLVWSDGSPPRYSRDLPDDHTSRPGGILLQVGPLLIDMDGEYRGGGVVEEVEENEGGCHRYDFLVCLWNGLNFFELFKLLFSNGIDHNPPCSLCSHDLCLFLDICFSLHMITWPREVIIVL